MMVAGGSCGGGSESFPPKPQVVDVTMRDYRFEYEPPRASGRIVFRARNEGRLSHELVLVFLDEGIPPLEEQLRSSERRVVPTLAGLPRRGAGRAGTFAVDLAPGRYGLICFLKDADGRQHDQKGMNAEFRIPGPGRIPPTSSE